MPKKPADPPSSKMLGRMVALGLGFRVYCLGFRGLGFGVWGLGLRVEGLGI